MSPTDRIRKMTLIPVKGTRIALGLFSGIMHVDIESNFAFCNYGFSPSAKSWNRETLRYPAIEGEFRPSALRETLFGNLEIVFYAYPDREQKPPLSLIDLFGRFIWFLFIFILI